jgi:hypothetical protein
MARPINVAAAAQTAARSDKERGDRSISQSQLCSILMRLLLLTIISTAREAQD